MQFKRIKKVGVELEGGWDRTIPESIKHDGSVRVPEARQGGEAASDPLATPTAMENWVLQNYPDHTNQTCGIHVHVSFNELNYSRIIDPDFYREFLNKMRRFHADHAGNGDERTNRDFDLLA